MAKIYALSLVSISEMRDSKIESIFSDEPETFDGKWEFLWTTNGLLSKVVDHRLKTYKTISGAKRYADAILHGKVRLKYRNPFYKDGSWITYVEIGPSTHKLVPVDITEIWNKTIDELIKDKKEKYEKWTKKILSKKV
jgi:hypothetical protein